MDLKRFLVLFMIVGLMIFGFGCPEDDDDDNNNNDTSMYEASQAVQSTETAIIETESGASIFVPRYAVPLTDEDENGTMVFSIERDQTATPILPDGYTSSSDIYRFGPDGFTFAAPVKVTIPISNMDESREYEIYRINPTTGEAEVFSSEIDYENSTISAYTYHLSGWGERSRLADMRASGALRITNNSGTHSLHVSVVNFTPSYPVMDTVTCSAFGAYFPARGSGSFVASSGLWYLQQGTYDLCFRMSRQGTISSPPGDPVHWYVYDVVIDQPWTYSNPIVQREFSYSTPGDDAIDGFCDCHPEPTPSAGTGDVQVTLTWHNSQAIDLDLWVTEPDSTLCYYGHTPTASGGTLDRDNLCSSYINGRPENIFWSSAPTGKYIVEVDWFSDCSNAIASQSYDVRIVNGADVRTFSGVIHPDETIEVASFSVSGTTLNKSNGESIQYIGRTVERNFERPAK